MNKYLILALLALAVVGAAYYSLRGKALPPIGGARDARGCLVAAGYAWSDSIGACVRGFELSGDDARAAKAAVDAVGPSYALTVVGVDAHDCAGCFTVRLEAGEDRRPMSVPLVDWEVPTSRMVKLYYYDQKKDEDAQGNILCSRKGLVPIEREIKTAPNAAAQADATIRLLLEGNITPRERAEGVASEYPLPGLSLASSTLDADGTLTLAFDDPRHATGGGSCRVAILWAQIEETARQFVEVRAVRFMPEDLFQP